jgi:hypothetical protein
VPVAWLRARNLLQALMLDQKYPIQRQMKLYG